MKERKSLLRLEICNACLKMFNINLTFNDLTKHLAYTWQNIGCLCIVEQFCMYVYVCMCIQLKSLQKDCPNKVLSILVLTLPFNNAVFMCTRKIKQS